MKPRLKKYQREWLEGAQSLPDVPLLKRLERLDKAFSYSCLPPEEWHDPCHMLRVSLTHRAYFDLPVPFSKASLNTLAVAIIERVEAQGWVWQANYYLSPDGLESHPVHVVRVTSHAPRLVTQEAQDDKLGRAFALAYCQLLEAQAVPA
jgi:hypothetical protein